ncbi:MAG TPA: protein kinase, partial [Nannocystaceae bacterium]|nr:protein kinase [Nannocystaceae bacterium]
GTVVLNAPPYAAPEQIGGGELTPAADVYALGVILYEMMCGRSPLFPAKTWSRARADLADDPGAWLRAHAKTIVAPLTSHPVCKNVPPRLAALVHRCLDKDPAARPKDAAELANELGWSLHHELGVAQAAVWTCRTGDARPSYHLIVPGSHRLARDATPLVGDEPLGAVLEWSGGATLAELVPEGTDVWVAGAPIQGRTPLPAGTRIVIGVTQVSLTYPKTG